MEKSKSKQDGTSGRYFAGFVLIGLGILFLLANWGIIPSLHRTWPLILIIVGIAFLLRLGEKEKSSKDIPSQVKEPENQ